MTVTEHRIDWSARDDRSGDFTKVGCLCGWRSAARHRDQGSEWWTAYAMHLERTLNAMLAVLDAREGAYRD